MSDPIGTVRREDHDGGYSVWQRIGPHELDAEWDCVWSTAYGQVGRAWEPGFGAKIEAVTMVIGAAPGTPAAEAVTR